MAKAKKYVRYVSYDEAYPVYFFTDEKFGDPSLFTKKEIKQIEAAELAYQDAQALLSRDDDKARHEAMKREIKAVERRHKMVLKGQIPDEEVL